MSDQTEQETNESTEAVEKPRRRGIFRVIKPLAIVLVIVLVEVVTAAHGRDALKALSERAFDAVFLDLEMPGMSGFDVVQALRRHERLSGEPPCFVVALSAHEDSTVRQQALACGFDRYASKPVSSDDVMQLLKEAARGMARQSS